MLESFQIIRGKYFWRFLMDGKNQYKSYKLRKQLPECASRTIKMSQFITGSEIFITHAQPGP